MSLVERLEWDSAFFGFPIGRATPALRVEELKGVVEEAERCRLRCTYLLVPASDHELLNAAQRQGFLVRDVRVELERAVSGHPAALEEVRYAGVEDLAVLQSLARSRFVGTRFFADPGFPSERSAELYVEWLSRALRGADGLAALMTNDASGFVVCDAKADSRTGTIGLIAVASDATGRGIGRTLVAGAGALFAGASLARATVVTQAHNVAALRLYDSQGYRIVKVDYWLHRWLTGGASPP